MAQEFFTPPPFDGDAAHIADAHSPYVVVRQTDFHLKSHFQAGAMEQGVMAGYLNEFTLPLIDRALEAVPMIVFLSREYGVDDYGKVKQLVTRESPPEGFGDQIEALDYSAIVFGKLPQDFTSPLYPLGFSNSSSFRAPRTIPEFQTRLGELRDVTEKIAKGQVKRSERPTFRPSLLRTEAFFDVGAKLPPPSQSEKGKIEVIHDDFNRLLEGVEIDL